MTTYQAVTRDENAEEYMNKRKNVEDIEENKWVRPTLYTVVSAVIFLGLSLHRRENVTNSIVNSIVSTPLETAPVKLYDEYDRFVMEDFDVRPSFSSFLPGVAGIYGKPVWAFYVNRGQGMASFGTESKDYAILEFYPDNKADQLTASVGFRTILTIDDRIVEPFSPSRSRIAGGKNEEGKPKRFMYVGTNEFEVKEVDHVNGLETSASYIVLPNENFGSLVRRMTFKNIGSKPMKFSALDGLAKIEPDGGKLDGLLKNIGNTLNGFFGVYHADEEKITMPYYRLSTDPGDTASVRIIEGGHYCLSFIESATEKATLLPIIYDTKQVFGENSQLTYATGLETKSISDMIAGKQYGASKTSSSFAALDEYTLAPGESVTIASFYGRADHIDVVPRIADVITEPNYVAEKFIEARQMMNELLAGVETSTSDHLFNGAVKQTFLDNVLRGGLPMILGDVDEEMKALNADEDERVKVYHVFSRIHGDLERDYNAFDITPYYFSQGPGAYRDVAQNRRNDIFFQPRMGSFDVKQFISFIQADGYEPLQIEAVAYSITSRDVATSLADKVAGDPRSKEVLTNILVGGPFRPGQLFQLCEQLDVELKVDNPTFINHVVSEAKQIYIAVYKSGYWADHWDYYLDLINAYLAMYPDQEETLMYDQQLDYFFSPATVKPRSEKYVLTMTFDGKSNHVLQLDSTFWDESKVDEQKEFLDSKTGLLSNDANWQRTPEGVAFTSTPIAKLFLLGAIKYATRDAYGMGVEYEGGRPGWDDAMNGLPGMVGSGMPETYELYLILQYVHKVNLKFSRSIEVPTEFYEMVEKVNEALKILEDSGYEEPEELPLDVPSEFFTYWDTVATAREAYREQIRYNFSGETTTISSEDLDITLSNWIKHVKAGMDRAMIIGSRGHDDDGSSGVSPCYFSFDVTEWKVNGNQNSVGLPLVDAKAMRVGVFPLFLEGAVRMMKTITNEPEKLKEVYDNVYNSELRDTKLNMYFLSGNLKGQSYDMGRMMAFSPGWLENQSIWMHMSYKYYLELMRGHLYEEFFTEMVGGGMLPYMDPDVYGRSPMELSSFIVSSAYPDPEECGRGHLPRLSGSTAEFLSIWVLMFLGESPYFLDNDGDLKMQLAPVLPIFLFDENTKSLSYKLFSAISVTYHNPELKNLYNEQPKSYSVMYNDGSEVEVDGPVIPTDVAIDIRRVVKIKSIAAYF